MTTIETVKRWVFVLLLSVITICIYCLPQHTGRERSAPNFAHVPYTSPQPVQVSPPQQVLTYQQQLAIQNAAAAQRAAREEAAAQAKAAREAAAAHAQYVAKYVNAGVARKPGVVSVGIVLSIDNKMANSPVADAIAARFKSDTIETLSDILTPVFISDGLFANLFAGSRDVLAKLDLATSLDALVLVRETVDYVNTPSMDNLVTANLKLDVVAMPVATPGQNQSWTFTANGPGFSQQQARQAAEERVIKQMTNDSKMSLNPVWSPGR